MKRLFVFLLVLCMSTFLMAASNTATINQSGNTHEADVTQSGSDNSATVIQGSGNGNELGSPDAGDPGIGAYGESDDLSKAKGLVQSGDNNVAYISQLGNNNAIQQFRQLRGVLNSVQQIGNANDISVLQAGGNNVVGQASSEYNSLEQVGNGNDATIGQSGNNNKLAVFYQLNDDNYANINQVGDNNYIASATQKPLGGSPANNSLTILQDGNNNRIDNAGEEGIDILGSITQDGDQNRASMQLSRTAAFGDIDQIGDDNRATITINKSYIGNSNSGDIDQLGNGNVATQVISQVDPGITSSNNTMTTFQSGDGNDADILVLGSDNQATINQTGIGGHIADITQSGDLNIASISSDGSGHVGSIVQTGNQNNALITQQP